MERPCVFIYFALVRARKTNTRDVPYVAEVPRAQITFFSLVICPRAVKIFIYFMYSWILPTTVPAETPLNDEALVYDLRPHYYHCMPVVAFRCSGGTTAKCVGQHAFHRRIQQTGPLDVGWWRGQRIRASSKGLWLGDVGVIWQHPSAVSVLASHIMRKCIYLSMS